MIKSLTKLQESDKNHVRKATANKTSEIWQNDIFTHRISRISSINVVTWLQSPKDKSIASKFDWTNPFCDASPLRHEPTSTTRNPSRFSQDNFINAYESKKLRPPVDIQCYEWDKLSLASLLQTYFIKRSTPLAETPPPPMKALHDNIWTTGQVGCTFLSIYLALCRHFVACTSPVSTETN